MDKHKIDSHKLMYHPERVSQVIKGLDGWNAAKNVYPLYIEVSPAGQCNARCKFCAVDYIGYKKNYLDIDIYTKQVKQMGTLGVKSIMFAGEGEPMLHPEINKMVEVTKRSGIDVSFTTNGTLMNDKFICDSIKYCSWIKVSLNGGTPESYAEVHQVKEREFERAVDNIKRAVEYRNYHNINCTIGVQCVVVPENVGTIDQLAILCNRLKVDYLVLKPYSHHKASITQEYKDIVYDDYLERCELTAGTFKNVIVRSNAMQKHGESQPYTKCMSTPFLWAYIMASGDVYSCSAYLLNDKFNLGNINDEEFIHIWTGEKRRQNYEFVINELNISDCRVNCRMDECNRYLDELKNDKIKHVNFI